MEKCLHLNGLGFEEIELNHNKDILSISITGEVTSSIILASSDLDKLIKFLIDVKTEQNLGNN